MWVTLFIITMIVLLVIAFFMDRRRRGLGDRDTDEDLRIERIRDDIRNDGHDSGTGGLGGPGGVG